MVPRRQTFSGAGPSRGAVGRKRPRGILIIALAYLVAPIGNVAQAAFFASLSIGDVVSSSVEGFGALGAILVLMAPVVGIGIYSGRRWGFLLFMAHALLLVANNTLVLVRWPQRHVGALLVVNVVLLAAVAYMLRKDQRAPFLDPLPRGWRLFPRVPLRLRIAIDLGPSVVEGETVNVSIKGALVRCSAEGLKLGALVPITLDGKLRLEGRVIRTEAGTAAVAFSFRDDSTERELERILRRGTGS